MNFRPPPIACLVLLLCGQAGAGISSWDEIQLQLLDQYSTPLRWDNVEGPPHWVSGPKPHYQPRQRLHVVQLQPGEEIVLRAGADTWLRLDGEANPLAAEDLEMEVSTDARLFMETVPIKTTNPCAWLVPLPTGDASLVRIRRPARAESNLLFAVYFSRVEPIDTIAPYRETVRLPGRAVHLRREGDAASRPSWELTPDKDIEFSLKGPARLQLVAVLSWPRSEPRREQSLVVQVTIDDTDPVPLFLGPELDDRHRTRADHTTELVSERMNGFFDVPEGRHQLRFQSAASAYLSVFRQTHPDYLLPRLNGPATNARQWPQPALEQTPDVSAPAFTLLPPPWSAGDLVSQEQMAWRLARDNEPRESGAQAADWLKRLGQSRRDYPAGQRSAAALRHQRTFYREILPARLPGRLPLQKLSFVPHRLSPLFKPEHCVAVYNPTREQVEGLLAEGCFATVPTGAPSELLYELPSRAYDSQLRLAVMTSSRSRTRLRVQFDQETPFTVTLDPASAVPADELAPSDALATLRVLKQHVQLPTDVRFGHPVGEFDLSFPVSQPGVLELSLPQHVRQVRIRPEAELAPVLTSVAYRAAKPFAFGETEYLALLGQLGSATALRELAHPRDASDVVAESVRELRNQLLSLTRLLRAHSNDFTHNVDLVCLSPRTDSRLDAEESSRLKTSALNLEKDGQWIEATGLWNRRFWEGTDADHMESALGVMRCLQSLGEGFLAAQYAKYIILESTGPQMPTPAVALLEDAARRADDTEHLEELQAVLFLRCPCPHHLAALTEALVLNGHEAFALSAGLILPGKSRPAEPMLQAALHQNWWQTYDQLVQELEQENAQCFWRAQKELAFHNFAGAEQKLRQSGSRGREMLQALNQGFDIRERLAAPTRTERMEALLAWEQWQAHQPGPKTWQAARDIVQECTATELLFNGEQDRFMECLRADRGKPVKLGFLGPLRLRVEARPLLAAPFTEPVNDWLEVVEYGMTNRVPVSQCIPTPSLQLTSSPHALVGAKTVAPLEWGPGWHEVELGLAGRSALMRVLQEQPALPTRILPTLNPDRMNIVLRAGPEPGPTAKGDGPTKAADLWWVPSKWARPSPPCEGVDWKSDQAIAEQAVAEPTGLSGVEGLRLALRMKSDPQRPMDYDNRLFQALPPSEQWLAACRAKRWSDFTHWTALPDSAQVSWRLATGRIQELLDSHAPRDVLQRLTTLLEISELFPAWREDAQCLAEALASGTNSPPDADRVLFRLTRDRTWIPLNVSPLSAGIRPIEVPSDLPQDPSTRLRRALLPPAGTNQFTLSGRSVLTASVTLKRPTRLELLAELVRAGFSPPVPLTISLQVDDLDVQSLSLAPPETAAGTNLMLSEGPHLARLWIADPVVNEFVRVSLSGSPAEPTNAIGSQSVAEAAGERRFFNTATQTQPVRFSWSGPAILRIDEWRDGRFISQLRQVPSGSQAVEIPPAPGRTESSYQIFVRSTRTNQPETRLASTLRAPMEVPPPRLQLPEAAAPAQVQLTDYYALHGQEDGTWTPSVLAAHRRPFDISTSQNTVENEFVEANVAYRKVTPSETTWFRTKALGRVHRQGDLTFGLSERVEGHPRSLPFDWSWIGEAFVGTVGPEGDVQWALDTGLELGERFHLNRKLDWRPFTGLFARYLSLDPNTAGQYDYIDQDLFTSFRYDHRWGGVLGCELQYRPWLDTLLEGDAYLMSNENFTPDNWGLRFSWTQLLGCFRGEVSYRVRYFLEDVDRSSESWLHGVSAGLYAEHWINGRYRIELGAQFSHDWPDSGNSYFLVFRWDLSQGRGYKDYSPHEMVFRDLRSRRIPGAFNNLPELGPPRSPQP